MTETQEKILDCIAEDKYISVKKIADRIDISRRTVENNIEKNERIRYCGSSWFTEKWVLGDYRINCNSEKVYQQKCKGVNVCQSGFP